MNNYMYHNINHVHSHTNNYSVNRSLSAGDPAGWRACRHRGRGMAVWRVRCGHCDD
jgi:hypothetical protein